jgi:hypothetical protein
MAGIRSLTVFGLRQQALPCFDCSGSKQAPKPIVYWLLKVLFAAEISPRSEYGRVSEEEFYLFDFAARGMAQLCTGPAQIVWSEVFQLHPLGTPRTTYQMTFSEMPFPQGVPCRLTALKIRPWPILAAMIQRSTASLTHMGMGTVLTRLPLPIKSTMAQCPCVPDCDEPTAAVANGSKRKML